MAHLGMYSNDHSSIWESRDGRGEGGGVGDGQVEGWWGMETRFIREIEAIESTLLQYAMTHGLSSINYSFRGRSSSTNTIVVGRYHSILIIQLVIYYACGEMRTTESPKERW